MYIYISTLKHVTIMHTWNESGYIIYTRSRIQDSVMSNERSALGRAVATDSPSPSLAITLVVFDRVRCAAHEVESQV